MLVVAETFQWQGQSDRLWEYWRSPDLTENLNAHPRSAQSPRSSRSPGSPRDRRRNLLRLQASHSDVDTSRTWDSSVSHPDPCFDTGSIPPRRSVACSNAYWHSTRGLPCVVIERWKVVGKEVPQAGTLVERYSSEADVSLMKSLMPVLRRNLPLPRWRWWTQTQAKGTTSVPATALVARNLSDMSGSKNLALRSACDSNLTPGPGLSCSIRSRLG